MDSDPLLTLTQAAFVVGNSSCPVNSHSIRSCAKRLDILEINHDGLQAIRQSTAELLGRYYRKHRVFPRTSIEEVLAATRALQEAID